MIRDLGEVVQSQHKMLVREGKRKENVYPARLEMTFKNQLIHANRWLNNSHNTSVLYINHADAIHKPEEVAEKVQEFLGIRLDVKRMATVADVSLHRERKSTGN